MIPLLEQLEPRDCPAKVLPVTPDVWDYYAGQQVVQGNNAGGVPVTVVYSPRAVYDGANLVKVPKGLARQAVREKDGTWDVALLVSVLDRVANPWLPSNAQDWLVYHLETTSLEPGKKGKVDWHLKPVDYAGHTADTGWGYWRTFWQQWARDEGLPLVELKQKGGVPNEGR